MWYSGEQYCGFKFAFLHINGFYVDIQKRISIVWSEAMDGRTL